MRTGVIAKKVGMTRIFTEEGRHIPVTVLQVDGCEVVAHRTKERDGYTAIQLGAGKQKAKKVTRAMRGHFAKAQVEPKAKLAEFRVDEDGFVPVGAELSADHFVDGQRVDVTGISIGKGFAGAMKRHNFRGLEATHGVSAVHRSQGSTGQMQDPGRVFKGKKMAGHLGAEQVTNMNLEVVRSDPEKGLIFIKGAVPGAKESWVLVRDAVKMPAPDGVPYPAAVKGASEEVTPEEGAGDGAETDAGAPEASAETEEEDKA